MFLEDVVEDLAVYVVEVCPREFGSVDASEHVEGPYAPVGCELFDVDFGFLFGCEESDFILDGSSPVEDSSAYIPCEGFDVGEVSHMSIT